MIKENQRLLNILHIIVDAIIIYLSFNLAYILRLDEFNSPLIRWHIISPPLGYYKDMSQYQNLLTMIVPCYLIIYGFCGMYDPKKNKWQACGAFLPYQVKLFWYHILPCSTLLLQTVGLRKTFTRLLCLHKYCYRLCFPTCCYFYLKKNEKRRKKS